MCDCHYLTEGLGSLVKIPDKSVDFVFSQAVLEHVKLSEFKETMVELRRILRPSGVCSHRIDLKDHLQRSLNNLRFSEHLWESEFMSSSGFYTNRIRYSTMISIIQDAGFDVQVIDTDKWNQMPIKKSSLWDYFRDMPDEELLISGFDIIITPK